MRRTPWASRSLPIVLHSIASLATAPLVPLPPFEFRRYSWLKVAAAVDRPWINVERASGLNSEVAVHSSSIVRLDKTLSDSKQIDRLTHR